MPSSVEASTSIATRSASKGPSGRPAISRTVTALAPARWAIWANSMAMNPPPTKTILSGRSDNSRNSVLVVSRSSPGMFSVIGRAPVAMWKCFARRVSPFSVIVSRPMKRASPCSGVIPALRKPASMRDGMASVKVRLNAIISGQLTEGRASRPLPAMVWAQSTPSVTAISIFLGSQPRSAQVPP